MENRSLSVVAGLIALLVQNPASADTAAPQASWQERLEQAAELQVRAKELNSEAKQRFKASLDEELARLTALQAVNPSVRDSELDALRRQREEGLAMLDKAALRLEAIRVMVAG